MTEFLRTLDRADLEAQGIEGYAYGYTDKVRFYELDALNHVNNVVYLRWFETIRVAYVQDYGFTKYSGEDDPQMVVRRVSADYLAPILQNQTYTVTARTTTYKSSSFAMEYALFVDRKLVATGDAVVVSLTPDGSARQPHREEAIRAIVDRDRATKG